MKNKAKKIAKIAAGATFLGIGTAMLYKRAAKPDVNLTNKIMKEAYLKHYHGDITLHQVRTIGPDGKSYFM